LKLDNIINNTLLRTLVSYFYNCIILQDNLEEKRPLNPKPSQDYSGIAIPNGAKKEAARGEYYYMYEPIFHKIRYCYAISHSMCYSQL